MSTFDSVAAEETNMKILTSEKILNKMSCFDTVSTSIGLLWYLVDAVEML